MGHNNTITVNLPVSFAVPTNPSVTLINGFSNCGETDARTGNLGSGSTGAGYTVTVTLTNSGGSCSVGSSTQVSLSIGATNPSSAGSYGVTTGNGLDVFTQKDATATASSPLVITGPATQIVLSGSTGNLTAGATRVITATIEDANGNTVTTGSDSSLSVTFSQTSGSGTVTGLTSETASGGIATDTVTGGLAGSVSIGASATASGGPISQVAVVSLTVVAGSASTIAISSGGSQTASVSTAFANPLVAIVTDAGGNPISGTTVTFTAPASGASGTFRASTNGGTCLASGGSAVASCKATTGSNGLASSLTYTANATAGSYNVAVTATGTTPSPLNFPETNLPGPASKIVLSGSTGNLTAGATRVITATIEDANGNTVTTGSDSSLSVTFSQTSGSGTVTGLTSETASGGIATDTVTGGLAGSVSIGASATASGGPISQVAVVSLTVVAGSASTIAISSGGSQTASVSTAFANPLVAIVTDAGGNPISGTTVTFTAPASGASGTFRASTNGGTCLASGGSAVASCKATTGSNGLASSLTYTANATAGSYNVAVTATGTTPSPLNFPETNLPGPASKIVLSGSTGNLTAGATRVITATIEDANGNTVTTGSDSSLSVTFSQTSGSGTVTGLTSETASGGIATDTVTGGLAGSVSIGASATASGGPISQVAVVSLTVVAGPASQLVFTTQPVGGVTEGTNFATSPKVSVEDAEGNVTSDTGNVTLAIDSGPGAGSLTCSNSGFPTITAVAGVATFTNCQITGTAAAGTYTLVATRTGLTSTGASSNVVINVGTATKLVFTTQPVGGVTEGTNFATSPKVSVEDAEGNVTSDTGNVTLAIDSGPGAGSLTCSNSGFPTITAVAGVATFTNCQITGTAAAGTYTLVATRTGLTSTGASSNVVINVGTANKLVFGQQPSNAYVGLSMSPAVTVLVEDSSGNLISSSASIALTITTNPCSGSPVVTNGTVNAVSGTATFSSLQISKECIGYVLTATDGGDGNLTVASSTFTVSAIVTSSANALQDAATDSGGSGMNSVTYYYCSGFTTSCSSGTPWTAIGSSTTSPNYQLHWTPLPANNSYSVVAVGTDNVTNSTVSTPPIPVTVDSSGPTGGAISVPNYANTLSVTITTTNFSDSISGMASNVISRSNGQAPTAGVCPTSGYTGATTVSSPDTSVANGNCYEYTLTGTANDGSSTSVTSNPVLVDTTAPVTTITLNPASPNGTNGWYDGTSPTFTLSATDTGGSGVATTYYEIDGGTQTVYPGSAVMIPDGSAQTISYWSVDKAGNVETTHTTSALKVDTTPPTGSITAPTAGATVSGSAVAVSSNSADSGSGVASAQFQYSAHGANSWTTIGTDTSSPYSVSWNTTSLSSGSYDLRVITTDVAGNSTTSATVTVTVSSIALVGSCGENITTNTERGGYCVFGCGGTRWHNADPPCSIDGHCRRCVDRPSDRSCQRCTDDCPEWLDPGRCRW